MEIKEQLKKVIKEKESIWSELLEYNHKCDILYEKIRNNDNDDFSKVILSKLKTIQVLYVKKYSLLVLTKEKLEKELTLKENIK